MGRNHGRSLALAAGMAVVALSMMGCTVTTDPGPGGGGVYNTPPSNAATASVRWSINSAFDPTSCTRFAAPTLDMRFLDQATGAVSEQTAACGSFTATIALRPGSYTANATLLDASGRARTTTVNLNPFTVSTGQNVTLEADFPSSSFY